MESVKIELLVIINYKKEGSLTFLTSNDSFITLIKADSSFDIKNNEIIFNKKFKTKFDLLFSELEELKQRFFHVKFSYALKKGESIEDIILPLNEMLRSFKTLIHNNARGKIHTLWNDISYYYAQKAYPLIHKLENVMRKLITKFMITKVGKTWKELSPDDIRQSIKVDGDEYIDYLYKFDFIELSDFLLKTYETNSSSELFEKIKKAKDITELTLEQLKDFIPKSNWQRYFSNKIQMEDNQLKSKWKEMYDLRNKVAHNNIIDKQEFEKINSLYKELIDKLEKSLEELEKLELTSEQKEIIAENVVYNTNTYFGEYLQLWKVLDIEIEKLMLTQRINISRPNLMLLEKINILLKYEIVDKELFQQFNKLRVFRNQIVHSIDFKIQENDLKNYITELLDFINKIKLFNSNVKISSIQMKEIINSDKKKNKLIPENIVKILDDGKIKDFLNKFIEEFDKHLPGSKYFSFEEKNKQLIIKYSDAINYSIILKLKTKSIDIKVLHIEKKTPVAIATIKSLEEINSDLFNKIRNVLF